MAQEDQQIIPAPQISNRNPALVYLASLGSAESRRTMRTALDTIAGIVSGGQRDAETLPWGALRYEHTSTIQAMLKERYKYTTANKMLSALRGVLKAAYKLGYLNPDEYAAASDIAHIKGTSEPAGRDLKSGELKALVEVCKEDATPAGVRDAAMIGVLYACGLRRSELVALTLADYEGSSGKIVVRAGKGNKDRTVYVTGGAQRALEDWIALRGSHGGPLFNAINKAGKIAVCVWHKDEDNPKDRGEWIKGTMTDEAVYLMLQKRRDQAGVAPFSPHDMRRTFVGDMLEAGADINTVSKLAGHASVTTTGRYDRRKEETKKKAANLLHFPY